MPETKYASINFRLTERVRKAIEAAAQAEGRTLSQYASRALEAHLRAEGFLNDDDPAPVRRARKTRP